MKFKSAYDYDVPSGKSFSNEEDVLGYFLNDDGVREFGVVGKKDIFAEIQRYKDTCPGDLLKDYLFHTFSPTDKGLYGERPSVIGDVNDLAILLENANNLYDRLPAEIKSKYKNMYEVVNNFNEEDFSLLKVTSPTSKVDSEVQKDE